jgi:hypothetical protein
MAMRQRCNNPNCAVYSYYGGRGITICKRWNAYANFLADMGERPDNCTLERKRNSRGYSKGNCVWASRRAQQNNTRGNRRVRAFGERKTASQWARDERCAVTRAALYERLQAGIRPEIAITTPPQQGKTITR